MTKEDVQKRVLKNGNPLDLGLFEWDEKTNTFSTYEDGLVLDFTDIGHCTFKTGNGCVFKAGSNCIFNTSGYCVFKTRSCCTFKTGSYCIFDTWSSCAFKTGDHCTFDIAGSSDDFHFGNNCVIIRRDEFEVIMPKEGDIIKICPYNIKGFISKRKDENDFHMDINGERVPHILEDGILSKIISKKGNVYKVINYGEEKESYLITDGFNRWSHGDTLEDAKKDLLFKLSKKDLTKYNDININTEYKVEFLIQMYHDITGSCSSGIKYFVDNLKLDLDKRYSVKNVIDLVSSNNSYGHVEFKKYFEKDI